MKRVDIKEQELDFRCMESLAMVYHFQNYKLRIYPSSQNFISEQTCFALSKIHTQVLVLPQPAYQNGKYIGCVTPWEEGDWTLLFGLPAKHFRANIHAMRKEVETLSRKRYRLCQMPIQATYMKDGQLHYDGTYYIEKTHQPLTTIIRENREVLGYYLKELIYMGMSRYDVDYDAIVCYLHQVYEEDETFARLLEHVFKQPVSASAAIKNDMKRKVKK